MLTALFRRSLLCLRKDRLYVFISFAKNCQYRINRRAFSSLHSLVDQNSVLKGFKLHRGLVGLDFGEYFAALYLVADFLVPLSYDPFSHGVTKLRHFYYFSHWTTTKALRTLRTIEKLFAGNLYTKGLNIISILEVIL